MFLGIESLPWLKHHAVDGFVVLPGPGYIAMAIQALKQLTDDLEDGDLTTEDTASRTCRSRRRYHYLRTLGA